MAPTKSLKDGNRHHDKIFHRQLGRCQGLAQHLQGGKGCLRGELKNRKDFIALTFALRLAGSVDYRLAVMAIASHDVDPTDQSSVELFFHKMPILESTILWRTLLGNWGEKYRAMFSAREINEVMSVIDLILEYIWHAWETEGVQHLSPDGSYLPCCRACHLLLCGIWEFWEYRIPQVFVWAGGFHGQYVWDKFYNPEHNKCFKRIHHVYDGFAYQIPWLEGIDWDGVDTEIIELSSVSSVAKQCMRMQGPLRGAYRPDPEAIDEDIWQT
ncbi:hypothetical protein F5Y05DRAFT_424585 [Hypoxylon sp. FL0543]|nr:hypothetical protein F5Y05DRAFT_424585 [Hypoxylon sp. FL0543]